MAYIIARGLACQYFKNPFDLKKGDEISYSIAVSGGKNDDISFTIYYPNGGNDGGGLVIERYSNTLVAQSTGTYWFEFDNTISILSNKSIQFSYEITKNTYYVYTKDIPNYATDYASNSVFTATEYWKTVFKQLPWELFEEIPALKSIVKSIRLAENELINGMEKIETGIEDQINSNVIVLPKPHFNLTPEKLIAIPENIDNNEEN